MELTAREKAERLSFIFKKEIEQYLSGGLCYKQFFIDTFHIDERTARLAIAEIAIDKPVITPIKGYKIAKFTPEDGLAARAKIRDLQARQKKLEERCKVLMKYIEDYQQKLGVKTLDDFELALKLQSQK